MPFYFNGHRFYYDSYTKTAKCGDYVVRWADMTEDMRYTIQCAGV